MTLNAININYLGILICFLLFMDGCKAQEVNKSLSSELEMIDRLSHFEMIKFEYECPCYAKVLFLANPSGTSNLEGEITNDVLIYIGQYGEYSSPLDSLYQVNNIYNPMHYDLEYIGAKEVVSFTLYYGSKSEPSEYSAYFECILEE